MSGTWIAIIGVGIVAAGVAVLIIQLRRWLVYQPLAEADPETRKAVRRALRTGIVTDDRVAELARGVARQTPRMRWAPWFFVPMIGLQGYVLVDRIRDRDSQAWLTAAIICFFIVIWVLNVVQQRRLEKFRTG